MGISEPTCDANDICNPVSVENGKTEGDIVADLDAIETVCDGETCPGELEETESQGPDTKFDAGNGSDQNLAQTY